jgi:hypothetical protein
MSTSKPTRAAARHGLDEDPLAAVQAAEQRLKAMNVGDGTSVGRAGVAVPEPAPPTSAFAVTGGGAGGGADDHKAQPTVHHPPKPFTQAGFYGIAALSIVGASAIALGTGLATKDSWAWAVGLVALALVCGLSTAIVSVAIEEAPDGLYLRRRILALDVDYLIVLFYVAFLYSLFRFGDSIPEFSYVLAAIWFAMLGSVAISLKGISDWKSSAQWDEGWRLWYWSRPASGLIIGIVTYFALKVVSAGTPAMAGVAIVAFLFGMQEIRFFNFLSTAAKLFLTTPGETIGVSITGVSPNKGLPGAVLIITGTNIADRTLVTVGGQLLVSPAVSPDGTGVAGMVPPLDPGIHDVMVSSPDGTAFVSHGAFTVDQVAPEAPTTVTAAPTPGVPTS